ncbi:MAG: glycoside hydrolase family 3 N-terminal domain-containing protein [Lachnospiraceae bacterium]
MRLQGRTVRILLFLEVAALVIVIIFGVYRKLDRRDSYESGTAGSRQEETLLGEEENRVDTGKLADGFGDEIEPGLTFSREVLEKLESMTTEEKVAQLFLTTPEALTHTGSVNMAGEITKETIENYPVGGLIYTTRNFQGKQQVRDLMEGTGQYSQERMGIPVFLAVSEYGGQNHSPLASGVGYEVQRSPYALSEEGDPEAVTQASSVIAEYLKDAGLNLNLAPNVEVATGEEETIDRTTYGTEPSVIATMAAKSVQAYHEQGILTAAGAFPDKSLQNEADLDTLSEENLLAYQAVIDVKTECLMIANTNIKLSGGEEKPCFLSSKVVDYVREELGYQGILLTDNLNTEAEAQDYSVSEAAVGALKAGMNMLYCSGQFEEAYQGVLEAVNAGEISAEMLDASVGRILTVKLSMTEEDNEE